MGQRKNSEFPWGIERQTFGFCTAMLYYWATETRWWVRPITKFIHDTRRAHCRQWISGSAMSIVWALLTVESLWLSGRALECAIQRSEVQLFFFVPHLLVKRQKTSFSISLSSLKLIIFPIVWTKNIFLSDVSFLLIILIFYDEICAPPNP